ncbi:MerR family transcriptional regulator [Nocardia sp. XZ_19_385]|uniref:MerR family transcriptional regulator n=1 Tax=Nocardia sp. XZ_19_385 TaxID=2769488 RepID=UPI00188F05A1|nr:MerR family transcriptional regulator [Nocardia sp. XZ_19_385]
MSTVFHTGEWSIQDLAKAAGTTSRTLRHYGQLGLLSPSRTGANGYRYYDQNSLVRLQRILLLRELGLGLRAIADVLAGEQDTANALRTHLDLLRQEQGRIQRQIDSVLTTLHKTERGEKLVATEVFDGFDHTQYDHTQYKDEVIERWGEEAYDDSDKWWSSLDDNGKQAFMQEAQDISTAYGDAHTAGLAPDSAEVLAITARHHAWMSNGRGGKKYPMETFACIGEMYVSDDRFRANYDIHGAGTAEFVRDAMKAYAETHQD